MSDVVNKEYSDAESVADIGLPEWQSGLSNAVNNTYSFANNSLFMALVPAYNRDYMYHYVRQACSWLDGFVPAIHDGTSGIMSTRIGHALISGLAKQTAGEKIIFRLNSTETKDKSVLRFVSKWAKDNQVHKQIYAGAGYSEGIGTSLMKINIGYDRKNKKQYLWWEARRFDQCFYLANSQNEVQEATFFIRSYVDTRLEDGKIPDQFVLVEHRYYKYYDKPLFTKTGEVIHNKGDYVPMVEYNVHRTNGTMMQNIMSNSSEKMTWDELPKDIKKLIKDQYAIIRIGEPQELGLVDLGVQPLTYSGIDISVPSAPGYGESLLVGIQDNMLVYEIAESYLLRDMSNGKGTLYQPESLNQGQVLAGALQQTARGGILGALPDTPVKLMRGVDPDKQKAIVQQFEIRGQEWQTIMENQIKNIAFKWNCSPKLLTNILSGNGQMTATQINSEDDLSISFIYLARSYFLPALNKLLETTLSWYGQVNNVSLCLSCPSLINKDRLLDRTIKELDSGLIDIDDALKNYFPDMEEEELITKIEQAKVRRDKIKQEEQERYDSFGDYNDNGGNYDNLSGDDFNGSTTPTKD